MQTPAEKKLISVISHFLYIRPHTEPTHLIDIGAGKSLVIEKSLLAERGPVFICDRTDVHDPTVSAPYIKHCYTVPVEAMPTVPSLTYDAAFSNYVLEHVEKLPEAAAEIARILKPGGLFVTSLPNPTAPEFVLSKYTPTWFHQAIKGEGEGHHAHETHYAYKNIDEFITVFSHHFSLVEVTYFANTLGYLYRFPVLKTLSRWYDAFLNHLGNKRLLGNVCLAFKKKI